MWLHHIGIGDMLERVFDSVVQDMSGGGSSNTSRRIGFTLRHPMVPQPILIPFRTRVTGEVSILPYTFPYSFFVFMPQE